MKVQRERGRAGGGRASGQSKAAALPPTSIRVLLPKVARQAPESSDVAGGIKPETLEKRGNRKNQQLQPHAHRGAQQIMVTKPKKSLRNSEKKPHCKKHVALSCKRMT